MTNGMYQVGTKNYPKEMTDVPLWLIFKLIDNGNGGFAKPPCSPITGQKCAKNDEGKFTDFERALVGVEQHKADGVGFVFSRGFMAIDLDDCFDDKGFLTEMAADIVEHFKPTYMEYSPSGNGLHIFCQGEKPYERTRVEGLEVYTGYNFVTVTGDHVEESGTKVLNMQDSINWMFETYLPQSEIPNVTKVEIVEVDHGDKTPVEWLDIGLARDEKLRTLYTDTDHLGDESAHDMKLLCKLTYWLNRDVSAIENFFFMSDWVQSKDYAHIQKIDKRADYFETTLAKAMALNTATAVDNERKHKNLPNIKLRLSENETGDLIIPLEDYTDVANAKAFADIYEETLVYTREWGWCYYTGFNWEVGQDFFAMQCAVDFSESIMYIAKQYMNHHLLKCEEEGVDPRSKEGKLIMEPAQALMKHAVRAKSERGIAAFMRLSESMLIKPASAFDSNAWQLNTPNMAVDLRTGEVYPPAWNHFNTLSTTLSYDPSTEGSGMWDDFLNTIFKGDQELIDYVQVVAGASCVGRVYEEKLIIANGCGSNGKSTFFGIIGAVLGEYCGSINPDILMGKVSQEQQITAATLKGKRLVVGQETEREQVLSTASVKRLVSTDEMVGRVLHHGYINFIPTHSLMMATNHLPKVKDNDDGTWRRLTVIPFEAKITGKNIITQYQDILVEEDGDYVLKWLVEGAVKFYQNGCSFGTPPTAVLESSNDYRRLQQDLFEMFVEDQLYIVDPMVHPGKWSTPDEVYARYLEWCENEHLSKPMMKTTIGKRLTEHGVKSVTKRVGGKPQRLWMNVLLKNEDGSDPLIVDMK